MGGSNGNSSGMGVEDDVRGIAIETGCINNR
jgi:hypothetical protein